MLHLVPEGGELGGVQAAVLGQEEQHHVVGLEALPGEVLGGVAVRQQGGQGEGGAGGARLEGRGAWPAEYGPAIIIVVIIIFNVIII